MWNLSPNSNATFVIKGKSPFISIVILTNSSPSKQSFHIVFRWDLFWILMLVRDMVRISQFPHVKSVVRRSRGRKSLKGICSCMQALRLGRNANIVVNGCPLRAICITTNWSVISRKPSQLCAIPFCETNFLSTISWTRNTILDHRNATSVERRFLINYRCKTIFAIIIEKPYINAATAIRHS